MQDPSYWYAFLALLLGVGGYVLAKIGDRIYQASRTPKSMSEHLPNLERAYLRVVHKLRELAEVVKAAEEEKRYLPPEYRPILDQVLMLARLVEHASYEDAVANGVVPRYWFGSPSAEQPAMAVAPPDAPATGDQLVPGGPAVAAPPPDDWVRVGDQLVPRRRQQQNGTN